MQVGKGSTGLPTSAEHWAEALAIFSTGRVLAGILKDRIEDIPLSTKVEVEADVEFLECYVTPRDLHVCVAPTKTTRIGAAGACFTLFL